MDRRTGMEREWEMKMDGHEAMKRSLGLEGTKWNANGTCAMQQLTVNAS